ncbi:methyltransferase domain-containing protein [Fusibacter sp. JL298sf-3]
MTFSELKSKAQAPNIESMTVMMEWTCVNPRITFGGQCLRIVEVDNQRIRVEDESIDYIQLHSNKFFEENPKFVISEAKRVLKRNGRIKLSFYHKMSSSLVDRFIKRFLASKKDDTAVNTHIKASMDDISQIISDYDLLIDKNFIEPGGVLSFEIIRPDNEKIDKMVGER